MTACGNAGRLALLAALTTLGGAQAADRLEQRSLKVGAFDRSYTLCVPAAVKADQPTAIVFAFHGAGGKGTDMLCCRPWASRHGWLLVCPDGLNHVWNAGSRDPAKADKSDNDYALVPALLDALAKEYQLDRDRVYATGFSNGGGMAVRLGVHDARTFAAIATVGHTLTKATAAEFPPARPLPVLIMIGSEDPGLGDHGKAVGVGSYSAAEAAARWAEFDGCGAPTVTERPGAGPGDPTTIRETHYRGGKQGSEVALYWLVGIDHTWLRAAPGSVPPKLDAGEVIFDFLAQHARTQAN